MTEILQDSTIATTTSDFTASKTLRGFALMDATQLRAVSSKGGSAPHASKRGFALMDENRLREVSQKGLLARRGPPVGDTVGLVVAAEEQPAVI
jgi:hypothetical protein